MAAPPPATLSNLPLQRACEEGNFEGVQNLLQKPQFASQLNDKDASGYTAIQYAITKLGQATNSTDFIALVKIVSLLLQQQGINIFVVTPKTRSSLLHLLSQANPAVFPDPIGRDQLQIAETLLNKGLDVNAPNILGYTSVQVAILRGSEALVELLLRWKADVNTVLENGENALHCAIRSQSVEKVNLILPKVTNSQYMTSFGSYVEYADKLGSANIKWVIEDWMAKRTSTSPTGSGGSGVSSGNNPLRFNGSSSGATRLSQASISPPAPQQQPMESPTHARGQRSTVSASPLGSSDPQLAKPLPAPPERANIAASQSVPAVLTMSNPNIASKGGDGEKITAMKLLSQLNPPKPPPAPTTGDSPPERISERGTSTQVASPVSPPIPSHTAQGALLFSPPLSPAKKAALARTQEIFGGGGTAEHPTPQTRAAALTTLLPKPNAAPIPGTTANSPPTIAPPILSANSASSFSSPNLLATPEKEKTEKAEKESLINNLLAKKDLLKKDKKDKILAEEKRKKRGSLRDDDRLDYSDAHPDMEPDTPEIQYRWDEASHSCLIKAATLEKLIEKLTSEKYPGRGQLNAFLLTYRAFLSPAELLQRMIARYRLENPVIQLRVLSFLKVWIESFFTDFEEDNSLGELLETFLTKGVVTDSHQVIASQVLKALDKQQKKFAETNRQSLQNAIDLIPPMPAPPVRYSTTVGASIFMELDENDIAREFTLIESALYCRIKPKECLDQSWNKKGKEENAPAITRFIARFNQVSQWVTTELVSQIALKPRAMMLQKMITLGKALLDLGNFNGAMSLLAGLNSSPVRRLKKTWEAIDTKANATFQSLNNLMAHTSNYKYYRSVLRATPPPCIPYLGVSLTDLTFIDQGFPAKNKTGLINFMRLQKIAEVVRDILFFQEVKYTSTQARTPRVIEFARNLWTISDDESWQQSLNIEPKNPDEAIESLLATNEQLKKQNKELVIAKSYADDMIAHLQGTVEVHQTQINILVERLRAAGLDSSVPDVSVPNGRLERVFSLGSTDEPPSGRSVSPQPGSLQGSKEKVRAVSPQRTPDASGTNTPLQNSSSAMQNWRRIIQTATTTAAATASPGPATPQSQRSPRAAPAMTVTSTPLSVSKHDADTEKSAILENSGNAAVRPSSPTHTAAHPIASANQTLTAQQSAALLQQAAQQQTGGRKGVIGAIRGETVLRSSLDSANGPQSSAPSSGSRPSPFAHHNPNNH